MPVAQSADMQAMHIEAVEAASNLVKQASIASEAIDMQGTAKILEQIIRAGWSCGRSWGHEQLGSEFGAPAAGLAPNLLAERARTLRDSKQFVLDGEFESRLIAAAERLGDQRSGVTARNPGAGAAPVDQSLDQCLLFGAALALVDHPEVLGAGTPGPPTDSKTTTGSQAGESQRTSGKAKSQTTRQPAAATSSSNQWLAAVTVLLIVALIAGGWFLYKVTTRSSLASRRTRTMHTP